MQLVPVNVYAMLGIADANERAAGRPTLYGALAICGWIGEFLVVEDVIKVETLDAGLKAVEVGVAFWSGVDFLS